MTILAADITGQHVILLIVEDSARRLFMKQNVRKDVFERFDIRLRQNSA